MKKLLVIFVALTLLMPLVPFANSPTAEAAYEQCFQTRKGNNLRDGRYLGPQLNAPALIQTWYWQSTANISTTPVSCGNRIYIVSNDRKVHCIDRSTGVELWESQELSNFPVSAPVLDTAKQNLYVSTGGQIERQSYLYNIDAVTGVIKWQWTPSGESTIGQISTGPTLVNEADGLPPGSELVLVSVDKGALFAIDTKNGARVWAVGLNGYPQSDPVIAEMKIFQCINECMMNIIDLKTGKIIQQVLIDDKNLYEINNTPAYSNGMVFVATRAKTSTGAKGKIYAVSVATGNVLWKTFEIDQFHRSGPSVVGKPQVDDPGILIGSDSGNTLYMFDFSTGRMRWSTKLGAPVTTDIILTGKYALFGAGNQVYAVEAANGNTVFKQAVGNTITGHPIVAEGMMYVAANDGRLYAFSDHDDFTIDVLPRSDAIYPTNKRSYKVSISATMNFSHPCILGAVGMPNTLKATFSKQFVRPGIEPVEVDLLVEASPDAKPGTYVINVSGMLLGRERNAILQIQILEPLTGDFKMSVTPEQLTPDKNIEPGDTISFQIKVEALAGFKAEVAFFPNLATVPSGMDVTFYPEKITPDGYTTVIIRSDTTSEADRYVIEVQGHAGGKIRSTNVWFTVGGFDTEDWPTYQQNIFRTGAIKEEFFKDPELRADFTFKPEDNPEAKVRFRTQPIIALGNCYIVGEWETKENSRIHKSALFALDQKTLKQKWVYFFSQSVAQVDNFDDKEDKRWPVMSTPAVDVETGKLYIGSIDGNFYCIDGKTGNRIWSYNTTRTIRTPVLFLKPPEVTTKRVYFGTEEGTLYCMAADTDKVLWKQPMKSKLYSGFSYAFNRKSIINKGMILVPCYDGNVYAFDVTDGTKYWETNFYRSENINTVAVDNDKQDFYFAGVQGDYETCYGNSMIYRMDVREGTMHWQLSTFGPNFGSPALRINQDADVIHVNSNWGTTNEAKIPTTRLVRVESTDRKKLLDEIIGNWDCQTQDYSYSSAIIDKNAQTITMNQKGEVYLFDQNGKSMFPQKKITTGYKSKAHPTMARRMLYIPTEEGHLLAYAAKWGFGLSPSTGSPIICQGTTISLDVFFRSEIPLAVPVRFKVVESPPDVTSSFVPDTLKNSGKTTLSITVGNNCPEGTHLMVIQAQGAGYLRSTTISLVVRKPSTGDFTFTSDVTKINVYAGEPAEVSFTIDSAGGFVGAVSLSADGLPTTINGAFAPIITTVPGRSKFKMDIAKNTPPGQYNLSFKAEGGCKTHTLPLTLVIDPPVPGDYSCKLANPENRDIVMWLGDTVEVPIAVSYIDGFNLPVTFEVLSPGDFPGITFTFKPSETVASGIVSLIIKSEFLGQVIDGKKVIVVTKSGRKTPKTQVSFILTVKKEQGGFSINPKETIYHISAGQIALATFEVNMTSNFNTSIRFSLGKADLCPGIEYEFIPSRLAPSRLTQRVMCVIKVPPTFLDNDQAALQRGLKECLLAATGIGGGQRVSSRDVMLRVYKVDSPQIVRFNPDYKGLKKKAADEVDVEIGNLTNACAVEFSILYDPLAIEVLEVTEGPLMTSDLKKSTFVRSIDPALGIIQVSSIREAGAGPVSGTGVFCKIKLRGTNITQETRMRIANIKILDCNNGYLSVRTLVNTEPILKLTVSGFLPGDVNGDGKVNTEDLILLGKTFGLSRGDPNFDARADFNEDGIVDGMDLIILCMNWGATLGSEGATP